MPAAKFEFIPATALSHIPSSRKTDVRVGKRVTQLQAVARWLLLPSTMTSHTTLSSSFGKIWTSVPEVEGGFITSIRNPTAKAGGLAKAVPFTAADFSFTGDAITTVDEKGVVVLLYITK